MVIVDMRLQKEELEKIKKENGVDILWSWSRISSWYTSKYEWLLHYVLNIEPDRTDCIYGQEGSYSHDILEKFYNHEIEYDNMITEFEDSWSMSRDVLGLKFNRVDAVRDESIAERYYENLECFFKRHNPIKYDLVTEDFALVKLGDNLLQGYIDAWYKDDDDNYHIIDWKTSTIYTGDDLLEKSGQLVCYAMAFNQRGIPYNKIRLHFNFLKYCTIIYEQANRKIKKLNVERRLLGEKLQRPCKIWLKKFGYNPDDYVLQVFDTADIKCLPIEVQDKIQIVDCYIDVPLTEERIKYWEDYINNTIQSIETAKINYEIFEDDSGFRDTIEDVKKQSFYYATLSGYSANLNPIYKDYLNGLENALDIS